MKNCVKIIIIVKARRSNMALSLRAIENVKKALRYTCRNRSRFGETGCVIIIIIIIIIITIIIIMMMMMMIIIIIITITVIVVVLIIIIIIIIITIRGVTFPNGRQMKQIDKDNGYKYLRIFEAYKIKKNSLKWKRRQPKSTLKGQGTSWNRINWILSTDQFCTIEGSPLAKRLKCQW